MKVGLICSCAISVVVLLSANSLADTVFSGSISANSIRISLTAVVPLALGVLTSSALLGLSRVRDSLLVLSILPYGITLVGVYLLAPRWAVSGALLAYSLAVAIALLFGVVAWHRVLTKLPSSPRHEDLEPIVPRLLVAGMPLLLGTLLQLVINSSGTVMLGMWAERTDVSQFSVAWRTATLISFVLIAVNTIARPKFAALYAQGNLPVLATTARNANLIMTLCAIPVAAPFLIAPTPMMSLFGEGFTGGAAVLQILAVGQFVNVAMGSVGILLIMSANEREYRNVQIVSALVALILNIILIPDYGAVGAAVSSASAIVVQNLLFAYFVWRRLRIVMLSSRPYRPRQ
jgi:O-antigen/teichoic acid export membrane protein